jgi:cupin superfamily acireductone dioxygenase involved in methionine salvage
MGTETIVILEGIGIFEFPVDDIMIELRVYPGDYVSIPKNMVHKFSSSGKIEAVRYFDGKSYEAIPYYNE